MIITDNWHTLTAIDIWHTKWRYSYFKRKIALLLRRILSQTPLGLRADELEELGTSLTLTQGTRITLLGLRRDH